MQTPWLSTFTVNLKECACKRDCLLNFVSPKYRDETYFCVYFITHNFTEVAY